MADEEKEKTGEGVEKKSKGGGLLAKVLIGLTVVTLQLLLSVVVVKKLVEPPPPRPPAQQEEQQEGDAGEIGDVYLVEDVIVNPLDSRGRKFVNTSVAFVYKGKVGAELEKRDVQLRDMLIQTLSSRTVEQLSRPAQRDTLREEILEKTNALLKSGKIFAVYFANFVMQ